MFLSKYFFEIKNRLVLLFLTWASTFAVSYFYKETLLFLFVQPQVFQDGASYPTVFYFIFTGVTEIFSVYITLVSFISVQITLFFTLCQVFLFLSPALYYKEYFYLNLLIKVGLIVWCFSIIMLTQVLIPLTWKFFLSFQYLASSRSVNLYFEAKLNEYLTFYVALYYLCVFYCQIFTGLFLFLNYINANIKIIRKFRKLYYYFFVLFATIVSPPDVLSQFFISITLIFLYELLVFAFMFKFSTQLIRQPVKTNQDTNSKK